MDLILAAYFEAYFVFNLLALGLFNLDFFVIVGSNGDKSTQNVVEVEGDRVSNGGTTKVLTPDLTQAKKVIFGPLHSIYLGSLVWLVLIGLHHPLPRLKLHQ